MNVRDFEINGLIPPINKALNRSLNRVTAGARAELIRSIRSEFNVPATLVRTSTKRIRRGRFGRAIIVTGSRLPLDSFAPRQFTLTVKPKNSRTSRKLKGISVQVKKGGLRKRTSLFPFRKEGLRGTGSRLGGIRRRNPGNTTERYPLVSQFGLSVAEMVNPRVVNDVQKFVGKRWPIELNSALNFFLGRT